MYCWYYIAGTDVSHATRLHSYSWRPLVPLQLLHLCITFLFPPDTTPSYTCHTASGVLCVVVLGSIMPCYYSGMPQGFLPNMHHQLGSSLWARLLASVIRDSCL